MFRSHSHNGYSHNTPHNDYNKMAVYEERDVVESYPNHHGHHHHTTMPETRERVEVIEYERVPEYGLGFGAGREIVREERVVETTDEYSSRRHHNDGFLGTHNNYRTYRDY